MARAELRGAAAELGTPLLPASLIAILAWGQTQSESRVRSADALSAPVTCALSPTVLTDSAAFRYNESFRSLHDSTEEQANSLMARLTSLNRVRMVQ